MNTHNQRAIKVLSQPEDNHFQDQFNIIYDGFFTQPLTMKELSVQTGIDRANICWYCRTMRKSKQLAVVKKSICSITKHAANKYTTNPALMPISSQIKLF